MVNSLITRFADKRPTPRPPWEDRFVFRSRDGDETRAFFDPFGLRFNPIGLDRALDARFEGELLSWETGCAVKLPLRGGFEGPARPHGVVLLLDVNR